MKFELLEKWLNDWKQGRVEYIEKVHDAYIIWSSAHATAFNNHQVRREIEVADYSSVKGRYLKTVKAVPVLINDKEYVEYRGSGQKEFFKDFGIGEVSQMDETLARYYTKEERLQRIEKDVDSKRKNIINRVKKICTEEIIEVAEVPGDGLFIRGANGKVAHMWAIFAGGYNIQCLHVRVLVKEAGWLK